MWVWSERIYTYVFSKYIRFSIRMCVLVYIDRRIYIYTYIRLTGEQQAQSEKNASHFSCFSRCSVAPLLLLRIPSSRRASGPFSSPYTHDASSLSSSLITSENSSSRSSPTLSLLYIAIYIYKLVKHTLELRRFLLEARNSLSLLSFYLFWPTL